jgi:hypothetical protein
MNKEFMKTTVVRVGIAMALAAGAVRLSAAPKDDREESDRHDLHVTKECSKYTGAAGSFCTITGSNLPEIVVGARVIYDQANGIPAGMLDSNVVLDAGGGNRAVGRCTLDDSNGLGVCTFSDGTGDLAGFHARVKVSPPTDGVNWHWEGFYSFEKDLD